jgi:hypothetical protein
VPCRPQPFLRRNSVARISDFRTGIPGCFHPMDPDEGASAWQRDRRGVVWQRQQIARCRTPRSPHSAYCRSHRPTACSRRTSFRRPLITMNHGDDGHNGNGFSKTGLGSRESATGVRQSEVIGGPPDTPKRLTLPGLMAGWDTPTDCAALQREPLSAIRTNSRMNSRRSRVFMTSPLFVIRIGAFHLGRLSFP